MWRALLARMVLGGTVLLALSSVPAEASTTFAVNSTGDAGDIQITNGTCDSDAAAGSQCTLRAAIEEANDTAGDDTIDFDISGTGAVRTISPASALPTITDAVTIDGYTQQGSSSNSLATGNDAVLNVQLDGINTGSGADGFQIEAADTTIKGLAIRRFDAFGIEIRGADSTGNRIEGNFIGVNRDGITGRGNGGGVFINGGDDTTIGGTQPDMRNVISANDEHGVFIGGLLSGGNGNRVEGNYIGTTADGDAALGNDENGVFISGASNNIIGGTVEGARNVISANDFGVFLTGSQAAENRVQGNYIGTTADGGANLGNSIDGVAIATAPNNTIGGTAEGARNVISANDRSGVLISGFQAAENKIEGNYIGTTADGTGNLGNTENGVWIFSGANLSTVGGIASGAGNRIAHNGAGGVSISGSDTAGNNVLSNAIFANAELGIDLEGGTEDANGVTENDTNDPDRGPNNLQNFPRINSATRSLATGVTTISGKLNSNATQDFVIQCFLTNGAPASAHGEGSRLLDTTVVSTNANGNRQFTCDSSLGILGLVPGQTVSATATNILTTGDTSEFSKNRAITTVL